MALYTVCSKGKICWIPIPQQTGANSPPRNTPADRIIQFVRLRQQLIKFAKAIADNHKEINQFGVSFKKPITVSVKIEGKHQIVIDNANAIGYLATIIANNLKEIEEHPWMQNQQVSISTHAEEKESVQIWLFYKMFNDFFNLEPYNKLFNVRQKKGSTISLSKTLLISRLIYFTKLSKHSKFSDDEDVLKGYIKQYKDKRIDTANSIYF